MKRNVRNVEFNSRVKLVKVAKDHLARMESDRAEAIASINAVRPVDHAQAVMPEFDGTLCLQAVANVQGDAQWPAWLAKYNQVLRAMERVLLQGDALLAGELKGAHDATMVCDECGCEVATARVVANGGACPECDAFMLGEFEGDTEFE